MRSQSDDIITLARGHWAEILPSMGVGTEFLADRHGPCPGCGGRDRFRWDDRAGRGTFVCGGGGDTLTGDGFDLLTHVHGWSAAEAFRAVGEVLGIQTASPHRAPARKPVAIPRPAPAPVPEAQSDTGAYARALWSRADRQTVPGHPYACAKRIWWPAGAGRVRASGRLIGRDADCIVVPIRGPDENLVAVEVLSEHRDPAGKFLRQSFGPKRQGWLILGNDRDRTVARYVCEGWATGAKLMEFMGNCCIYVSFGAGRMAAVAAEVERRWPGSEVTICAEAARG
jgi:hypothetical protein